MISRFILIFIIQSGFLFAQNYGALHFTNYAEDRKSAFSLTFDDGLLSHTENAVPILNQFGFKGTFYVLPPFLAETNQSLTWRYGRWTDFQSISDQGHEIGSHTMMHYDLTSLEWGSTSAQGSLLFELYQSKNYIEQKIPSEKCISLNYPFTLHNSLVDSAAGLFYENGRSLGQVPNDSSLSEGEWYGLKAKVVEFSLPRNYPADDLNELYDFLEWTQSSIDNRKWGMIILHDVVPFSQLQELIEDDVYEPISSEWLGWLCEWLFLRSANKEIWIETVGNITRYIKERDNAEVQIISSTGSLIEISVTDELDNSIFNYPLSAYVKVPGEWHYVEASQYGYRDTLATTYTDSGRVALVKVVPDKGSLRLIPVTATSVDEETGTVSEFELFRNYPNPFNPSTVIGYQQPAAGIATIKVYDILGNEVATLLDEFREQGKYELEFNSNYYNLPSGVYLFRLKAGNYMKTRKMILLQ